ncbi:MAG: FecR family protein [Chitinophagaceae bacterium]
MPQNKTIEELYEQYLANTISHSDLQEFLLRLNNKEEEEKVAKLMEGMWNEMFDEGAAVVKLKNRTRNIKWFSSIAAAAVVVILAFSVFFLLNKNDKETFNSTNVLVNQNDIPPGREGAILTLSDGQVVLLDTARNGILAQQGSLQVIKNNGQIQYSGQSSSEVLYNTMTTPNGRQYNLVLADGSRVWLNAASSVNFPTSFPGDERKVSITGEAYFEIAHNPSQPFIVSLNGVEIKVLGTHFNVMAYTDEGVIKATLLEGKISVQNNSDKKLLSPGQQAEIKKGEIIINNNVSIEEAIAWKNGAFYFQSVDIENLMRQVARWYDVDVVYSGEKPKDRFTGSISRNINLSQFLKMLEYSEVNFKIQERKIIVMP